MVEAMYERSPDYFKRYQKSVFYFTSETVPESIKSFNSFAYGYHNESCKDFCLSTNIEHYHFMIETDPKSIKDLPFAVLSVPCVYSTFKFLISTANKRIFQGELFSKLQSAVLYNSKNQDKATLNVLRKRVPRSPLACETTAKEPKRSLEKDNIKSVAVQTDLLHSSTLERFQLIIDGARCADLLRIMDILQSGCGRLSTNSSNSSLNFSLNTNN